MPIANPALTLKDLPTPPDGKTGWPWTEQTEPLSECLCSGSGSPQISIVIPNYNCGRFLEETIRSALLQSYPNAEFIIIDGGSTDNSVEIIKKYEKFLAYWVSEPDRGQSHAINKGFERCTGDYIAWMNSSDCYLPKAFQHLFQVLKKDSPDFMFGWAAYGGVSLSQKAINYSKGIKEFNLKNLLCFFYSPIYIIPSQSVFLSKSFLNRIGPLDESLHYCMDLDWYARVALRNPVVYVSQVPICFYRFHDDAKTSCSGDALRQESIKIAEKYINYLPPNQQRELFRLIAYSQKLEEYRTDVTKISLFDLVKTISSFPLESIRDTRFLGLLKKEFLKGLPFMSLDKFK